MDRAGRKISHYRIEKFLGEGQFAKVYLAISENDNKMYAIKCILKSKISNNQNLQKLLKTEVSVMNNINHPNIMHLFEFLESANNYYLVINYCNKGDLENFLMKQPGHRLTETHALYFLKQIMNGFQVLLNYRVMHRDFKLANIFLHDDTVVIGDFGFAKSGYDMAQTRLGTPYTMAPEVHSGTSAYTSKADLWSIGMVFYQLLYGEFPFTGLSVPELMASIREKSGKNLTFPDQVNRVSDEIKVLLVSLLQMDPKDRISWEDFFNHPVFLRDMANTSEQASNQGQLLIANHVKAVEKEFKDNKKQIQEMKDVSFTDATGANMISAEQINETLSDSPLDKRPLFKEYSFRYYHEKNKILVIFLTVKKLRQLMKERPFREHLHTLYLLMMVLAKKGAELSELTILSLAKKNNIFRLEQFDAYCQDTPEYQETLEQLNKDQQIINDYRRYIKQLRNELGLSAEENDIFLMCEQQFIELRTLDETARNLFHHLRELGEPDFLNTSPTSRHFYLLTMVFTIYSIRSEAYLPYIGNDNNKFEWDTFKQKHDDLNCDQLNQLLLELER